MLEETTEGPLDGIVMMVLCKAGGDWRFLQGDVGAEGDGGKGHFLPCDGEDGDGGADVGGMRVPSRGTYSEEGGSEV